MKKTFAALLALVLSLVMAIGSAYAVSAAPEGGFVAAEAVDAPADSEGGSAENASEEGESPEGESAEEAAPESESGEDASESAEAEGEGESEGEQQEGGFTTTGWQGEETGFDPIEYLVIPAEGDQAELGYLESTPIIEADALKFKDLNKNGELDIYEDWRQPVEDRVEDLYAQMTDEERCMLMYHVCTCGDNAGVTYNYHTLYDQDFTWGEKYASMWFYITQYGITTYLDNSNGTPDMQVGAHNVMQAIAEETRLGVPVTLSCDRQYNAWGGYIDSPKNAFVYAHDMELAAQIYKMYAEETRAIGYHVILQPVVELASKNGENPEYVAEVVKTEVEATQEGGIQTCTKHYVGFQYAGSHSDAMVFDSWFDGWRAAIASGTMWIMSNSYNQGIGEGVKVDYDKVSLSYLRNELGYDGIVLTDWGAVGNGMAIGIYDEGGPEETDVAALTLPERYAWVINNGVDQLGAPGAGSPELALEESGPGILGVGTVKDALDQGLITPERIKEAACRILTSKFASGIFENPYSDGQKALELSASPEFAAEKWEITDNETLEAARNPEEVELERQLMAKSTILVKNDDNLLPLDKSLKVYVESTASSIAQDKLVEYFSQYAEVVEDMEEADVVVADLTSYNDQAEYIVEDAKDFGKKLVIVCNCVEPDAWTVENADALLYMTFTRTADHGTGIQGIIITTEPDVYAQIVYGDREPAGMIISEVARDSAASEAQWKDMAGDMGADNWTRMILLAMLKTSEDHSVPENFGDPLLCYKYGMRYGTEPEFVFDTLVLPKSTTEVTEETSSGTSTSYQTIDGIKSGEPFSVYSLLWNNGADGMITVNAAIDGEVAAQKVMAVNGGSWRIIKMDLVIDEAGEHTVTVGDITKTITVE